MDEPAAGLDQFNYAPLFGCKEAQLWNEQSLRGLLAPQTETCQASIKDKVTHVVVMLRQGVVE
jgi:hypothetical protein